MSDQCFLIFGGGGLVGLQIARRIADKLTPAKIVIASLLKEEVDEAIELLESLYGHSSIKFEGVWGNIFVREDYSTGSRNLLLDDPQWREDLYNDMHGPIQYAYERSHMVRIIQSIRPDVIVDAINTATAISYQDVYTASWVAKQRIENLLEHISKEGKSTNELTLSETEQAFETLLLAQSIPQLVRHVSLLNQVMREVGTRLYIKIGTTGTGGMGLNIPYTHGEDKPSAKLMSKTAIAFAHTGLLFLMARTAGGPIVKEIKPGAMIGYADVVCRPIYERGNPVHLFNSIMEYPGNKLILKLDKAQFDDRGQLDLPVVDTGENGLFTRGEFEAITSLRQMEFITPEEIAREAVLEIIGSNTGRDVIAAVDGAVMNPTYRAGYLRHQALAELEQLEKETQKHSVALGQLGPPQLSKLLWEAELLRMEYTTLRKALTQTPEQISDALFQRVQEDKNLCSTITSIGVPIFTKQGFLRGPFIRIPEIPGENEAPISAGDLDHWAKKGWVDLRPANMETWQTRIRLMEQSRKMLSGKGSAAITRQAYLFDDIRSGTIVGWVFNNEEGGYRIK
jgi:hypothetical protein